MTTTSTMDSTPAADREVEEIDSLCMNCHEDGVTRLLLTKIPFFKEIVIMSFSCPHCHFSNAEISNAGEIQQRGIRYRFKANMKSDLERQVVKSDSCVFRIEDLDIEIPAGRGQLTNLEGLISMVKGDLETKQDERKTVDETLYHQIEEVIRGLSKLLDGTQASFTVSLDDPTGNSFIEPSPKDGTGKYTRSEYARSPEQNEALGLGGQDEEAETTAPPTSLRPEYHASDAMYPRMNPTASLPNTSDDEIVENQVYSFPASCPGCTRPCSTHMKMVRIPHFSEVVIMSTVCDLCGYRSNEVKSGGAVPAKGRRITLRIENSEDMSRDILKAESCAMSCPELSLNVEPGTLGGRFTTVEGLLTQVRDDLKANVFDTDGAGDSMQGSDKTKWTEFFGRLDSAIQGELKFTIVLEDPLAASYVQSFMAPEPDAQMEVVEYDRTAQEEEELGLTDMKTEGYEEEHKASVEAEKARATDNKAPQPTPTDKPAKEEIDVEEIQNAIKEQFGLA